MLKHIVTDSFKHALSDIDHQSCIGKGGKYTRNENTGQRSQRPVQPGKIRRLLSDQRDNKVVQQKFQRQRYGNACS